MNGKTWAVFIIIVLAVVGGMVYLSMQKQLDISDISRDKSMGILAAEERNGNIADHVKGNPAAKVVVIEYGDFQCEPCKSAHAVLQSAVAKHKDHVAFVYRNFPIANIHAHARSASAVAEAAGLQGKYWEMHDLLYERQETWANMQPHERRDTFKRYIEELGLDTKRFTEDVMQPAITKKIGFDTALARSVGVSGTPTLYVNGELVKLTTTDSITEAIEAALKKNGVAIPEAKAE